ncbi:class I SAM-dependent methyltransferase [Candidatus Bathyarchaeota archaeon]|nr:MAG: class I SAM-dependent methyltransferase [Candidatus Bathyarchaeota archaeon]
MSSSSHPWELAWKEGRWQELSPPLPTVKEFSDYLKTVNARNVLDLGCGAGRHAIFLAREGFNVVGLDVSETALGELEARRKAAGIGNVTLVKHEMQELPFIDDYFDAIVSTNVLHHGTTTEIRGILTEVHRIMRKNGVGFIITLSKNDFRYGNGTRLEQDTFQFTEGDERGIVHHFFTEKELKLFFEKFEILSFSEDLIPVGKGNRAHFFLKLRKP